LKKKLLFIYNPRAGKGKIKNKLSDILELFVENRYEVVTYTTLRKKDATRIVLDCLGKDTYDLVVCSGGDGTLNEVINGMMACTNKVPIGYIPSGTTNDFAYSLNLPKNLEKAAAVTMNGEDFLCDIGSMNGEYFTYTAAFGLFTDASYETPQTTKNVLGRLAYILEGILRLPNWKSYTMEILYEDKVIKENFIFGVIANSNSIGGFRGLTGKDVLLDDGLFEAIFIKTPQSVMDLQGIINDLLKGNLRGEDVYSIRTNFLTIKAMELIPWSIDGEFGGEFQAMQIVNHKQAITIKRPKIKG
jgi:YegS/Rv2252/BmrU family lipid kinase